MNARVPPSPLDVARQHWGDPLPDWIEALARECAAASQRMVGDRLKRSPSLVSRVLRNSYPGDLAAVEEAVRGAFMGDAVNCPTLGWLPTDECQLWRKRSTKFASVNPTWVRMNRACNRCPRNKTPDRKET
ncbi:hypothetical protein P2H44_06490 [Albimonas sp. CAU 1670]|uniref:hypothetical protein n=1 Tax=Albimonas sp. CAU 1670 TaxID=3032599 RepID=UPI0023DA70C0|nr:hypothetical protein [Albimonas sp. CAU 1670]MDF2232198.1 hypothetical protein [Albimonas sp. CAU 1670]